MSRLVDHIRHQLVGYIALFVALAGTSYAAFRVPVGSVGERQLVNHAIDPVKLNPTYIGGYVRKWATVDASGHVIASGGKVKVTMPSFQSSGTYVVNWLTHPVSRCSALVSLEERGAGAGLAGGSVTSGTAQNRARGVITDVATFAVDGTPKPLSFDIALLC